MGKRKMEMKKIENRRAFQVNFSKWKNRLFKKAEQLSLLIGASVLIIAFSPAGRPFLFGDDGLMQRHLEGETNIPKALENEEHLSLDNIDLEYCSVDELELLVTNLVEEEANIATKAASEQQLTFGAGVGFPTLEVAPIAVIDGVEATQLHDDLEIFLTEIEEEGNTSSQISPISEDFFNDFSNYYMDSFLH